MIKGINITWCITLNSLSLLLLRVLVLGSVVIWDFVTFETNMV